MSKGIYWIVFVFVILINGCTSSTEKSTKREKEEIEASPLDKLLLQGKSKLDAENFDDAIQSYISALSIDSTSEKAKLALGEAYCQACEKKLKYCREGLNVLSPLLEENPNADAYFNRSIIHYMLAEYQLALADIEMALKEKDTPSFYLKKAEYHYILGQTEEACRVYEKYQDSQKTVFNHPIANYCTEQTN